VKSRRRRVDNWTVSWRKRRIQACLKRLQSFGIIEEGKARDNQLSQVLLERMAVKS